MKKSARFYIMIGTALLALGGVAIYLHAPKTANDAYICVSDCAERGFSGYYCQKRCAPGGDQTAGDSGPDPRCYQDCKRSGQTDDYCTKTCRYY